jgi:hypothetical protein
LPGNIRDDLPDYTAPKTRNHKLLYILEKKFRVIDIDIGIRTRLERKRKIQWQGMATYVNKYKSNWERIKRNHDGEMEINLYDE